MDRKKVKIMTRMAAYEQTIGRDDLRISQYYKKDYASLHMWFSLIWLTIGYLLAVGLVFLSFSDQLFNHTQLSYYIRLGTGVVVIYVVLMLIYAYASRSHYKRKHTSARKRVKGYMRDVVRLEKMYESEEER